MRCLAPIIHCADNVDRSPWSDLPRNCYRARLVQRCLARLYHWFANDGLQRYNEEEKYNCPAGCNYMLTLTFLCAESFLVLLALQALCL